MSTASKEEKRPGVASLEEITKFVEDAGDKLLVVDLRNPDASKEPEDQQSFAVAGLPSPDKRPNAMNLIWDRDANTMPDLPETVSKDTPIITHCGAGGRGQQAKVYLELKGYTNVINGGGPKETDLWNIYGDK
jgi:rhodanese-related sulfurtransferase